MRIVLSLLLLVLPTSWAQFGVPGGKRQANTNFEDLQERAKARSGDEMDYQKMMEEAMQDPEYLKRMGEMGSQFGDAMEQMMKMSPEELQQQMEAAMKMMTDGDIVENIVNQRDEVLKSLETSGLVPKEELEKYKNDPNYFELKMRESFGQMEQLFQNPDYLSKATEAMQEMAGVMNDPKALDDLMSSLGTDWSSDENLEEMRQQFLKGEYGDFPGLGEAFETAEMQDILKDPKKWKETVKEGMQAILGGGSPLVDGAKAEL